MKKILAIMVLAVALSSCYVAKVMTVDSNVQKLQLGMTLEQIQRIMGKQYILVRYSQAENVIGYETSTEHMYYLWLENGRLTRISREIPIETMMEKMKNTPYVQPPAPAY